MSSSKGKNVVLALSPSEEEMEDDECEFEDDEEDDAEEELEDDSDDDEEYDDSDDDFNAEDERDTISISSSEDGIELSEGEADPGSIGDDSEEELSDEANCARVIKLLQGESDLRVLKLEECKSYLRKHELRLTGTKEICIQRIQEHWRIKDGNGENLYPRSSFSINCRGDVCQGDVVLFAQRVYNKFDVVTRGGKPIGKRTIAGRVVKESYGAAKQQHTFTVEILWSKGPKKLPPLFPLLIKGRNLYRLKTFRQQWEDEAARSKILAEKHKRGAAARHKREIVKSRPSNAKLRKPSHGKDKPIKRRRNERPCPTGKARRDIAASSSRKGKTKITANSWQEPGFMQKRQSHTRTAKKDESKGPMTKIRTQKPYGGQAKPSDISSEHFLHANLFPGHHPNSITHGYRHSAPSPFEPIGRAYAFSESSWDPLGLSRNNMAVPSYYHASNHGHEYFHPGFDPRHPRGFTTQGVHRDRPFDAELPVLQRTGHGVHHLPCSMRGCKDMGAKDCVGGFCWRCCTSTQRQCPRHRLSRP